MGEYNGDELELEEEYLQNCEDYENEHMDDWKYTEEWCS